MNLNELLADCYRRCGFPSTPATTTTTRLTAFLNECQQDILSEPGFDVLLTDSITFPSVASQPTYALPQIVSHIQAIRDTTNRDRLDPMSAATWRELWPNQTAETGTPRFWVDLGTVAVTSQPATTELFFVSTSASDNNTKSIHVEGYLSNGSFRSATVAMNGVTSVSLGATITTWIEVTKFEVVLAAGGTTTAAGVISLSSTAGGTAIGQIYIGQARAKYRSIALAPTPASAVTYTVDFGREVSDMVDATDEPILPTRFHRLLATGARMKEYETTDNDRYLVAKGEWEAGLKQLRFWVLTQRIGSPNLRGSGIYEPPSRLGAWYPSIS